MVPDRIIVGHDDQSHGPGDAVTEAGSYRFVIAPGTLQGSDDVHRG